MFTWENTREEDNISLKYFRYFAFISLWKGAESPSPKGDFCQVWLNLAQWFRRRFFNSSMYFCYFVIISPWNRAWSFLWTNLNYLHPRMLCPKFGWNWPSGSGNDLFLNFINVFSLLYYYLQLEEDVPGHSFVRTESHSSKEALYQVWLKMALWF